MLAQECRSAQHKPRRACDRVCAYLRLVLGDSTPSSQLRTRASRASGSRLWAPGLTKAQGRRTDQGPGTDQGQSHQNEEPSHGLHTDDINGKSTTVDVPPDMPLLWVLRDALNLKGTKFGCGIGQCGACTVHVDGKAVRSCQTPVSTVAGAADHDDRGAVGRRRRIRCSGRGRSSTCRSAATARPAS